MTQTPISASVLGIALLDDQEESALLIGEGPQNLTLELTNLSDHPLVLDGSGDSWIRLTFRPGTLEPKPTAYIGSKAWNGSFVEGRHVLQTLVLAPTAQLSIGAGATERVVIEGLVPSAAGGSRSTRVDVEYHDVRLGGEGPVSGRRTVHLAILHPSAPASGGSGSIATSGPLTATIVSASDVITGMVSPLVVQLATTHLLSFASGQSGGEPGDDVGRLTFSMPLGMGDRLAITSLAADPTNPASGLGEASDGVETPPWLVEGNDVVEFSGGKPAQNEGTFIVVHLDIETALEPGLYPLSIKHENIGERDGVLVLLVRVTAIGAHGTNIVANRALTANSDLSVLGAVEVTKTLTVNEGITAAKGLAVRGDYLTIDRGLRVKHGLEMAYNPEADKGGVLWAEVAPTYESWGWDPKKQTPWSRGVRISVRDAKSAKPDQPITALEIAQDRNVRLAADLNVAANLGVGGSMHVGGPLTAQRGLVVDGGNITSQRGVRVKHGFDLAYNPKADRFGVLWANLTPSYESWGTTQKDQTPWSRGVRIFVREASSATPEEPITALEIWPNLTVNALGNFTVYGKFTNNSDRRIKRDVAPLGPALEQISRLVGVRYRAIDDPTDGERLGFIAQDLQGVFPNLVETGADGLLTIRPLELLAPIVEAVKELAARVSELEESSPLHPVITKPSKVEDIA